MRTVKPPRSLCLAIAVVAVACFCTRSPYQRVLASAPVLTFTVSGTVTDTTGATVANATVVLLSDVRGTQITFTDQNGNYSFNYEGGVSHSLRVTASKSTYIFNPVAIIFVSSSPLSGDRTASFVGAQSPIPLPFGQLPILLTQEGSLRSAALDSVTQVSEPFGISNTNNFSSDQRTRISLFAASFELWPNEPTSVITAQAEDSSQAYPLTVETVRTVPNFPWLKQIVVKLPDGVANSNEVRVNITLRGVASNLVLVKVKP